MNTHTYTIGAILTLLTAMPSLYGCIGRNVEHQIVEAPVPTDYISDSTASPEDTDSMSVGKQRAKTPYHHFATAIDALRYMSESEHSMAYTQGILMRMAMEHLPYAERLINNRHDRFLIVDKGTMSVMLFDRFGRLERKYRMACALNYGTKHEKADSRTPEGFFSVSGIYDSTDWLFTDDDGVTSPKKGQFGPKFIRLRIPGTTQIGIHGTSAPWSIGARCSHGCIRLTNEHILQLVPLVEIGMPVIVNPSLRDTRVNLREGYEIPWISPDSSPRYPRPHVVPDSLRPIATTDNSATD